MFVNTHNKMIIFKYKYRLELITQNKIIKTILNHNILSDNWKLVSDLGTVKYVKE